jgi:hypothetical protein
MKTRGLLGRERSFWADGFESMNHSLPVRDEMPNRPLQKRGERWRQNRKLERPRIRSICPVLIRFSTASLVSVYANPTPAAASSMLADPKGGSCSNQTRTFNSRAALSRNCFSRLSLSQTKNNAIAEITSPMTPIATVVGSSAANERVIAILPLEMLVEHQRQEDGPERPQEGHEHIAQELHLEHCGASVVRKSSIEAPSCYSKIRG